MGEAARWLVSLGVTHVAMEATGIDSMPVYYALLEHGDFGKVLICNAAYVKNVPGRKADYADAAWLAHLLECGLLGAASSRRPTRGTMRGKIARLEKALDCALVTEEHAAVLAMMLATIDYCTARIEELTAKIEVLCQPYLRQIEQLDAVPGTGVITAQDVIAEIGTHMAVFPTAAHLVSWAKWCPQAAQSGGKRKGANASGRGNLYLGAAPGEAAVSADRTQSFPGAKYRRLVKRMPKKKALVATDN